MVSFQCSPLATAEGIQSMFRQCARYQKNKNMDAFVSVVVLDEVGLAEDSPKMALKVCILFFMFCGARVTLKCISYHLYRYISIVLCLKESLIL